MKPQTYQKNVIGDILQARNGITHDPLKQKEPAEGIVTMYTELSDNEAKLRLDHFVKALCGKSLGEILKDYEEPDDLGQE